MATVSQTIPVTETMPTKRGAGPVQPLGRNVSMDAYRGFVMLLMMAEVLQLSRVAAAYPASLFWKILAFNQTHVEWFGCSLHDIC
jgi:heparan-alpha-glucosaminide N-acetyltransferase